MTLVYSVNLPSTRFFQSTNDSNGNRLLSVAEQLQFNEDNCCQ
jgi:hypothetical protein